MEKRVTFQLRRGDAIEWATKNPVLANGEPGFEDDGKRRFKLGDGVTPWNDLEYAAGGLSAYEVAVRNGYTGTESQWLQEFVNEPGPEFVDLVLQKVLVDLEPEIDLVIAFENALIGGQ